MKIIRLICFLLFFFWWAFVQSPTVTLLVNIVQWAFVRAPKATPHKRQTGDH